MEGETQEAIAQKFNMSRIKVGKLLKHAHTLGIVDVRVRHHSSVREEIEKKLIDRFAIQRALIAPDYNDPDKQRASVASMVADYLIKNLDKKLIVAVGMGRNVAAVAENVFTDRQYQCSFICAIGGSLKAGQYMNPDHICRHLATQFGGENETLYAPAFLQNPELRQALLQNKTVKQTLDRARRADFALIGVGDMSEESNMVRMGWFTSQEIAEAHMLGTVGDMMGYDFIDIHGNESKTKMQGRIVGLQVADLKRIPDVIAIASEKTKSAGILGALRTGAIDTLATSYTNALTILSLEEATRR
ncbi:MAG: sugar-binding transcriptional regulator [Ostreibacterium sp.]